MNVAGNNLLVHRTDLSLDTRLGTHALGATYNSASGTWRWTFEMQYDGVEFVDNSGARHSVGAAPWGEAIPGTHWIVLDDSRIQTKGGLVHEFAAEGHLGAIRWASGEYPRIATRVEVLAGERRVTRLDQCTAPSVCTELFRMKYDEAGHLEEVRDRAGRRALFAWDAQGRLVQARDGLDVASGWPGFRYEYEGGLLTALTNSEGERIEYVHAGHRLDVRAMGEGDPTWSFRRRPRAGGLYATEATDPLGGLWSFRYDAQRRLHARVDPLGQERHFAWEGLRPSGVTLEDGSEVAWVLDGDDVAAEMQPSGNVVEVTWAPTGSVNRGSPAERPLLRLEDALGLREARDYDAAGRLIEVRNGEGESTRLSYGTDGSLASLTRPDGRTVFFEDYGDHGHARKVRVDGETYTRSFDEVGNLLSGAPGESEVPGVYARAYDADRNVSLLWLTEQWGASPGLLYEVAIERRSDGRRRRIARVGWETGFEYDALGRLMARTEEVDGRSETTRFTWDEADRLVGVEHPNGAREEVTYDALGRVVERVVGRGTPLVPESTLSLTWASGRLTSASAGRGTESYVYDEAGRVSEVAFGNGDRVAVDWDLRSRPTRVNLDGGAGLDLVLEAAYDRADREIGLSVDGSPLLERSVQAGRIAEVQYGNGLRRAWTGVDPLERTSRTTAPDGSTVAESAVHRLEDTQGGFCLELRVESLAGVSASLREEHCLAAPTAGRVSTGTVPDEDFAGWTGLGNPLGRGNAVFRYGADPRRLLAVEEVGEPERTHSYDEAGYTLQRGSQELTWDGSGRITSLGSEAAFQWDALGRPAGEIRDAQVVGRRFGGLVETDGAGAPVAVDLREVRIDLVSGDHRYRHFDARGNVAFTTGPQGVPRSVYRYGAFGVAEVRGATDDPVRFALGRDVGGLVLLGHRLLDPETGRFLAPDPVYQMVNPYTYAHGNPLLWWDPSGLEGTFHGATAYEWSVAFAAGAAGGGIMAHVLRVTSAGPLIAGGVSVALLVIDAKGGFPWEGDRTLGDLLPEGPVKRKLKLTPGGYDIGGVDVAPIELAGIPQMSFSDDLLPRQGSPERTPEREITFPDGTTIPVCGPRIGRRADRRLLVALAALNLVLGTWLALRRTASR